MASRLIRNQLPARVAGSTPVSSATGTAVTGGAFFVSARQKVNLCKDLRQSCFRLLGDNRCLLTTRIAPQRRLICCVYAAYMLRLAAYMLRLFGCGHAGLPTRIRR